MQQSDTRRVMPVEVFTRVCGYYRPIQQANKGKQSEFDDRKEYDVNNMTL